MYVVPPVVRLYPEGKELLGISDSAWPAPGNALDLSICAYNCMSLPGEELIDHLQKVLGHPHCVQDMSSGGDLRDLGG